MLHAFYQKHTKHIKISPGYSWTTRHCQNDRLGAPDIGSYCLLPTCSMLTKSVTWSLCKRWELFFVKPEWKSMDSVNGISYYLSKCSRYQTHHRWQFFFQEDSALVHCACNTVQLLQRSWLIQHLSEKFDFRVSPFCQVVQNHKLFEVTY